MTHAPGGKRSPFPVPRRLLADLLIAFLLALPTVAITYKASWRIPSEHFFKTRARDILFDSDPNRVFSIESDRSGRHIRSSIHPVYSSMTYPPVWLLRKAGFPAITAVHIFHAVLAGLWVAAFFLLMRWITGRRLDALVFTAAGSTSAAAFFMFPLTETFVLGSLTMLPAYALAAWDRERPPLALHILSAMAGMSATLTNGMASMFASLTTLNWRRLMIVVAASLAGAFALMKVQLFFFPITEPDPSDTYTELAWVFTPEAGGGGAVFRSFFFHSMTAPELRFLDNWREREWPLLSFQASGLFTGSRWALIATSSWMVLLILGVWALFTLKEGKNLRLVIGLTLAYQFLLHAIYGRETFLYAMHFLPPLLILASFGARTRARPLVLALVVLLAVANTVNNTRQFLWATAYAQRLPAIDKSKHDRGQKKQTTTEYDLGRDWLFWTAF